MDEQITLHQSVISTDNRFNFVLQGDGNLVLYFGATVLWTSATWGTQATFLVMQGDGNLVLYGGNYVPVWYSDTSGNPGARFVMQSDGNAVIYSGSTVIWSTGTGGH